MKVLTIPETAQQVIDEYEQLPLGGKKVVCPYHINPKIQRAGLRVYSGKGDPGEITREVKVIAQLKGIDLAKMSGQQIREFMQENRIGVDCSGFVVHVVNYWLKRSGLKPLITYLEFPDRNLYSKLRRVLRPVEQIGANLLTGELNCKPVDDFNEIRPGDFIRSKGLVKNSHHISLITNVQFRDDGEIEQFSYVHSQRYYEEDHGIREGTVFITKPNKNLLEQTWTEEKNKRNWTYEGLEKDFKDNGIRRLKRVKLPFSTL